MAAFFAGWAHGLRGVVVGATPPAGRSALSGALRHHRVRRTVGGLAVVFATLGAIVIAVIAIAVIGHRSHTTRPAAPSAGSACTSRLLAALGGLRRPQTQADRAFHPPAIPTPHLSSAPQPPPSSNMLSAGGNTSTPSGSTVSQVVVPGLTRLARTLSDGRRVFLVVYRYVVVGASAPGGDFVKVYV